MKLAVDPTMIRHLPVQEVLRAVGEIGYEYVELSPRLDVLPPSRGRRVSLEATARIAAASRETGVGVASLFVVYPWASPEEGQRAAAVRYLEQACEVAVELGCGFVARGYAGDPLHRHQDREHAIRVLIDRLSMRRKIVFRALENSW